MMRRRRLISEIRRERRARTAAAAADGLAPVIATGRNEDWSSLLDEPAPAPGPTVSVVMPVYNMVERGLADAIESVLGQSYGEWELVVVDDGSTDETARILDWYQARDPRIRVHARGENHGVCAARNAGFHLARGQYIAFLDGDDRWRREKLASQVAAMRARPEAGWSFGKLQVQGTSEVGFNWVLMGREGPEPREAWEAVRRHCLVPSGSVMVARSLLQLVGGHEIRPEFRGVGHDWDQWIRFAAVSDAAILREPLYWYSRDERGCTARAAADGSGAQAVAICRDRARRLQQARMAVQDRRTRVAILGLNAQHRGAQVFVLALLRALAGEFEVTVALREVAGELLDQYRELADVVALDRAEAVLRRADVIHWQFYGWDAPEVGPTLRERLVITEHSIECRYTGVGRVCRVWQARGRQAGGTVPDEYWPPGIEVPVPVDLPEPEADVRTALGIGEGPIVLGLMPARRYKGARDWMRCAAKVAQTRQDVVWVMAGVREGEADYDRMQRGARELRAGGAEVHILAPQGRARVAALCREADLLLHLSHTESQGMALLEAQAMGTPVVATAVGGARQAIWRGRTVPRERPEVAAAAVLEMLETPRRVPERVQSEVRARHDPRAVAARYGEIYRWIRLQRAMRKVGT